MSKFRKKRNRECRNEKRNFLRYFKGIFLNIFLICGLIGIFILYLTQVNSKAANSYKINELEADIDVLSNKKSELNLQIADLKSMNNLDKRIAKLNLIKSDNLIYLEEQDRMVAAK